MISDEYTREYDERMKAKSIMDRLQFAGKVAEKLGLFMDAKYRGNDFTINLTFFDGRKYIQFRKLETAVAWSTKFAR